jgi:hypothetical protein
MLLATLVLAAPLNAQQAAVLPERLMIGPEEYLKGPQPFPVNLASTSTRLDTVRAQNLAPRDWGMANARPCRAVAISDTTGWKREGGRLLPDGFAPDSTFRAYHGGLQWKSKDLAISVLNNWWGVVYDGGYLTSCRVNARAGEYIVRETRTATGFEFTAFPWDPRWGPSSGIVAQAPTEDGLRVLWTAFMTMLPPRCAYMTGGPVQDPRAPPC